jgi:hypothetical protein
MFFFNKGCPPGYYGQTCDFNCEGDDDYCKGLLICLPDPYGCSCYTGWYGTSCNLSKEIKIFWDLLISILIIFKVVQLINMVLIVLIHVHVPIAIDSQVFVSVMVRNVIKVIHIMDN